MDAQAEKAETFRKLHSRRDILVLPNAWDVPSARVFEDSGFRAVATSSAGLMVSLGYPDGEEMPLQEFISAIGRIAGVLSIPLSADVVSGYGADPDGVARAVRRIVEAGAIGVNIEDFEHQSRRMRTVEKQLARLKALVKLRDTGPVRFVINARTDALRFARGDDRAKFTEAVRRGEAYRDNGADCIYPMGLVDSGQISEYVQALKFPVNVMVRRGLPSVSELKRVGVARVSFGPSASYAALGLLRRASDEILAKGTYEYLLDGAITFDELNRLAVSKKPRTGEGPFTPSHP